MTRWQSRWRGSTAAVALLAALAMAPQLATGAESALVVAQRALKAGNTDVAIQALSSVLAGGALKGGDIAKAYYLRGLANSKAGNQAAAISDLNNALWLKGLSESERRDASAAKTAAYRKAGIPVIADVATAEPASEPAANVAPTVGEPGKKKHAKAVQAVSTDATTATEPAANAEPLPWTTKSTEALPAPTPVAVAQPEPAAPAVSSLFGSLFGLGSTSTPAPQPPPPTPATADNTASTSEVMPAWKTAAATEKPAAAAPKSGKVGSGVYVQVASLRTTADAEALAAKLTNEHAAALGGVSPSVAPVVLGNMGTFYAVRLGPVANKSAGQSLCAKLRKEGVDCFFATP